MSLCVKQSFDMLNPNQVNACDVGVSLTRPENGGPKNAWYPYSLSSALQSSEEVMVQSWPIEHPYHQVQTFPEDKQV